jgi:hypothetical protein
MPISFSVIIEWENAKLSELGRAHKMLFSLSEQINKLDTARWVPQELIILYDGEVIDHSLIADALKSAMGSNPTLYILKLIPISGRRYYELKNYGATITEADVLVFLDSDVIPEPGWLAALLGAIEKPEIGVVCGNTYIDVHNLYTRAFALFWFFPLRASGSGLIRTERFFANNVAFRKKVFNKHPFPASIKLRGQCGDLSRQLVKEGHRIYLHEGARVRHPPPNGFLHFIKRALCAGHDYAVSACETGKRPTVMIAVRRCLYQTKSAMKRCWSHRAKVNLGMVGSIAAMGIAGIYFGLAFAGECLTIVAPTIIPRYFAV